MTIIYENFTDLASVPDHVAVTFFGVPLRMNFDDDGVITPRPIEAVTVNGVATSPELDPGVPRRGLHRRLARNVRRDDPGIGNSPAVRA